MGPFFDGVTSSDSNGSDDITVDSSGGDGKDPLCSAWRNDVRLLTSLDKHDDDDCISCCGCVWRRCGVCRNEWHSSPDANTTTSVVMRCLEEPKVLDVFSLLWGMVWLLRSLLYVFRVRDVRFK